MAIKLHRCSGTWVKGPHPCWKVQKALDDAGVPYEIVKHPIFPRGRRQELKALSGQDRLPVLELEDGTVIREESKDMAERIAAGRLAGGSSASETQGVGS